MRVSQVIAGLAMFVVGILFVVIAVTPSMTCSVIQGLGGNCFTLLGNQIIEEEYRWVPSFLLIVGGLLVLLGAAVAALGGRSR